MAPAALTAVRISKTKNPRKASPGGVCCNLRTLGDGDRRTQEFKASVPTLPDSKQASTANKTQKKNERAQKTLDPCAVRMPGKAACRGFRASPAELPDGLAILHVSINPEPQSEKSKCLYPKVYSSIHES